jgi:hypothetical protein
MQSDLFLRSGAHFSNCRVWRWALWRVWNPGPTVANPGRIVSFIGLNPSTADETVDDPTIRRCIGFARDWGFDGLFMLNLFGFRATDPAEMKAAADPVGKLNDDVLRYRTRQSALVVAAWGVHGDFNGRAQHVIDLLMSQPLMCLGRTKDGHPKHPLYLPRDAKLVEFSMEVARCES